MSKPCIVKTNLESFTKKLKLEVAHTKYTNLKKTNFDKLNSYLAPRLGRIEQQKSPRSSGMNNPFFSHDLLPYALLPGMNLMYQNYAIKMQLSFYSATTTYC